MRYSLKQLCTMVVEVARAGSLREAHRILRAGYKEFLHLDRKTLTKYTKREDVAKKIDDRRALLMDQYLRFASTQVKPLYRPYPKEEEAADDFCMEQARTRLAGILHDPDLKPNQLLRAFAMLNKAATSKRAQKKEARGLCQEFVMAFESIADKVIPPEFVKHAMDEIRGSFGKQYGYQYSEQKRGSSGPVPAHGIPKTTSENAIPAT